MLLLSFSLCALAFPKEQPVFEKVKIEKQVKANLSSFEFDKMASTPLVAFAFQDENFVSCQGVCESYTDFTVDDDEQYGGWPFPLPSPPKIPTKPPVSYILNFGSESKAFQYLENDLGNFRRFR